MATLLWSYCSKAKSWNADYIWHLLSTLNTTLIREGGGQVIFMQQCKVTAFITTFKSLGLQVGLLLQVRQNKMLQKHYSHNLPNECCNLPLFLSLVKNSLKAIFLNVIDPYSIAQWRSEYQTCSVFK